MEEVIVYGTRGGPYDLTFLNDWYYNEANGQTIWDRDLDWADEEERARDCNELLIRKPSQCTTDPGTLSNYVNSFEGWPQGYTGIFPHTKILRYRNLFQNALLAAAANFRLNQDSNTATAIFFDAASYECVEGDGQSIPAPTIWPISNSVYCLVVADRLARTLYPDFSLPSNYTINLAIFSFPLSELGPWGSKFYEGITGYLRCRAWYNEWNSLQC